MGPVKNGGNSPSQTEYRETAVLFCSGGMTNMVTIGKYHYVLALLLYSFPGCHGWSLLEMSWWAKVTLGLTKLNLCSHL